MHDWFMNFFYYVKVHTYRIHRITRQIRPDLSGTGFTGIPVFFRYPVEPVAVPASGDAFGIMHDHIPI
jgi:hypothetical protein